MTVKMTDGELEIGLLTTDEAAEIVHNLIEWHGGDMLDIIDADDDYDRSDLDEFRVAMQRANSYFDVVASSVTA